MNWISPHILIESVTLVFAFIYLRKDHDSYWKLVIWFLLITVLIEITGFYVLRKILQVNNAWLYNIYTLLKMGFVGSMLIHFLSNYVKKPLYLLMGLLIPLISFLVESADHGILVYHSVTNTIMSVIFVIYGWYYFYLLLKSSEYVKLSSHAPFWWISGISFYCFGSVVCDLVYFRISIKIDGPHTLRYYIFIVLNILLYGFWTYSYICRQRITKLQPS